MCETIYHYLAKLELQYQCANWEDEMGQAVTRFVGSDLFTKIGKLVYYI